MKIFFDKIFQLEDGYQEILIDENNFQSIKYNCVLPRKQHVGGLLYEDIYVLEPLGYYEIKLGQNTPYDFNKFTLSDRLLQSGLIMSDVSKKSMSIFVHNCTQNHIYIKKGAIIGEIE